jgi:hypothetical protein
MKYWRAFPVILCLVFLSQVAAIAAVSGTPPPAAAKAKSPPVVSQTGKVSGLPGGQMSGEITSSIPGKTIRDIFGTAKNITLDILDENGVKVGTVTADDSPDGKSGRYKIARDKPRHFSVKAPGTWLYDQLQWQYYQQWTTGDDSRNVTNIVLKSISPIPKWRGIKGDITGSIAGYTPDQWFGGKDKIAIKAYDAGNKLVDMATSHQGYGGASTSYDIKVNNPAGYRVEAPHIHNQLKFTWEYQVKSEVDGVKTIDIQLKNVNPLVVLTAPAANSKIWLNQQVKISWVGPPSDTPVVVGYRWPAKIGTNFGFGKITTLDTNPGTYTWNLSSQAYGYPHPMIINNNDPAYCSGYITIRGGGYGNNVYWSWDAEVPVWFMTPYVRIKNIASYSDFHAGDQLTINFDKVGLSSPQLKVTLKNLTDIDGQNAFVWHTSGNSLTIPMPTKKFPDRQFILNVEAEGESSKFVAGSHSVLININQ